MFINSKNEKLFAINYICFPSRYMSPAKIGEDIMITAHILKQGKTLAFTSVDLMNKTTGKLVAQGRHTKHLGNQDQHVNWKIPNNKDQV